MPERGPDGKMVYHPREAYNYVGSHLYRWRWSSTSFLPGPNLPHPPEATRIVDEGGDDADAILEYGEPQTDAYKSAQASRYRTNEVLNKLFDTLRVGKAKAYKHNQGEWTWISSRDFHEGEWAFMSILSDIERHHREGKKSIGDVFIEKDAFERWIAGLIQPPIDPDAIDAGKNKSGRKGVNWDLFRKEIGRREEAAELPDFSYGWRGRFSHVLSEWYKSAFENSPVYPKPRSISKELKPELDRLVSSSKIDFELSDKV